MSVVDNFNKILIVQIGCGGTGSWLVPSLSKFVGNIRARVPIEYFLIDDDYVEQRNILRQNFHNWDISKSKTSALINRCCYNDQKLTGIVERFNTSKKIKKLFDYEIFKYILSPYGNSPKAYNREKILVIIVGCVDNNKTRKLIYKTLPDIQVDYYEHNVPQIRAIDFGDGVTANIEEEEEEEHVLKFYKPPIVYIDSGNNLYNGQIVTTWFNTEKLEISGKDQEQIDFKKMFKKEKQQENNEGCVFFGDQSQAINTFAATLLFCSIQRIFTEDILPPNIITFNASGYSNYKI